ncbi:bifunctional chorismate mutase/prephenate dehydrogenase [Pseudidiomarina sediminum]|uniref:T-protein n=1 Tax=Pseudidiomarina sediminum TaxID=431675 RepID=A0A432Z3H5_9GAMM|nr:bifunctional chorismate mutase/prephenate dehydrogenase [Pseudidiomarina sediminum]MBY6064741.1 bifunctional chorismate mutase/prephenate dehydrogenase [Pseudidiomarina sediminum]RUO72431.1 bifunctional chorismate mutase/prephenate dehydrogenase [Pseudidiomarina sediminum]
MSEATASPAQRLAQLREAIDATDSALLQLLQQRRQLATEVGVVKRALGQPLYVPEREAALLSARRAEAEAVGLSPDLIEDVLRRVMRESYLQQQAADVHLEDKTIVVVGGDGALGGFFAERFAEAGAEVFRLGPNDWQAAAQWWPKADLVLFAVPIDITCDLIAQLPPLPEHCVLADITSIKVKPMQAMLAQHQGPVVGLHPMFGPQLATLAKQLIVVTDGRQAEAYQWLLETLKRWGAQLYQTTAARHDEAMGFIQVMRHLSTFVYGAHLQAEHANIQELLDLSSPIYRLELMMVGRLFAQNADLYADIILAHPENFAMMRRYLDTFNETLSHLERGEKSQFTQKFTEVGQYFGEFSKKFLEDSQRLLASAGDAHQLSKVGGS